MRDYNSGKWGFALIWGLRASVFPQAFCLALPNAICAFLLAFCMEEYFSEPGDVAETIADNALKIWGGFTSVLFFVLYFRSNVAYSRWWEGGTLLQQTRGEWFNAYSSLIAFSSADPARESEVEEFHHMLARFMSLLFSAALQQVSPDKNRPFETISSQGIDPKSLEFLNRSSDKVEVILQWIQRSTILNMGNGVLPIPPPVMSRAFQEISRGIVNLQNARKIADFPFPFPYAQTSIVMLLIHWCMCPLVSTMLLEKYTACATCFAIVFFVWCINYIALYLEMPFGDNSNDLPMAQMQSDWNKSIGTLLAKRAQQPPTFTFEPERHRLLELATYNGTTRFPDFPTDIFDKEDEAPAGAVSMMRRLSIQVMGQMPAFMQPSGKSSGRSSMDSQRSSSSSKRKGQGSKRSSAPSVLGNEPQSGSSRTLQVQGEQGLTMTKASSSTSGLGGEASWTTSPTDSPSMFESEPKGTERSPSGNLSGTGVSSIGASASQSAAQRLKAIANSSPRAKAGPLQPRSSSSLASGGLQLSQSGPAAGAEVRKAASTQQSPQPSLTGGDLEVVPEDSRNSMCKPNQWPGHATPSALSFNAGPDQLADTKFSDQAGYMAAVAIPMSLASEVGDNHAVSGVPVDIRM